MRLYFSDFGVLGSESSENFFGLHSLFSYFISISYLEICSHVNSALTLTVQFTSLFQEEFGHRVAWCGVNGSRLKGWPEKLLVFTS